MTTALRVRASGVSFVDGYPGTLADLKRRCAVAGPVTVVACDSCDASFTHDGGLIAATFGEVRAHARDAGWRHRAGRDTCPTCIGQQRGANQGGSS